MSDQDTAFDSTSLTQERFARRVDRTTKGFGAGSTEGGQAIAKRYLEVTKDNVKLAFDAFQAAKSKGDLKKETYKGVPLDVFLLDPYVVALVGIQSGISSVVRCDTLSKTLFALGMALEDEVYAHIMRNWDAIKAERVRAEVRKRGSLSVRKTVMRSIAASMGFSLEPWSGAVRLKAGQWLLDLLLEGDVFTLYGDTNRSLTLTEDALEVATSLVDRILLAQPVLLPLKEPPTPWAGPNTHIHGYRVNLVRSFQKPVHKAINGAIRSGRMASVLKALNAIQDVPWSINQHALDMVEWAYGRNLTVGGLPAREDLPLPQRSPEQWEAMTEDEQKVARKDNGAIKQRNRGFIGERLLYTQDVRTARHLADGPFWTPVNMDYRGRVYGLTSFQFQRQDYVRSLFLFEQGKPVDAEGMYWLKVHVANTGAFDKIDKAPFDERINWVNDNLSMIYRVAKDPKENLEWTKADSPFMFLVACRELWMATYDPGYICRLPVSFDGTCSGLQHLGAMTRDEHTSKYVNLTNNDRPQDVYNVVADLAKQRVEADSQSSSTAMIAQICLEAGIGRSLVKRNVMTYSYSSGRFGMGEQHMEDTMTPLSYKVMTKELSQHPYQVPDDTFTSKEGNSVTIPGRTAAKYLAGVVYGAIEATVHKPAEAMRFLQGIAKALSHEGKPVVWHTPLGMPVVLRYTRHVKMSVQLFLHDKGVTFRHQALSQEEAPGIDKARASNAEAASDYVRLVMDRAILSNLECLQAREENAIMRAALERIADPSFPMYLIRVTASIALLAT